MSGRGGYNAFFSVFQGLGDEYEDIIPRVRELEETFPNSPKLVIFICR